MSGFFPNAAADSTIPIAVPDPNAPPAIGPAFGTPGGPPQYRQPFSPPAASPSNPQYMAFLQSLSQQQPPMTSVLGVPLPGYPNTSAMPLGGTGQYVPDPMMPSNTVWNDDSLWGSSAAMPLPGPDDPGGAIPPGGTDLNPSPPTDDLDRPINEQEQMSGWPTPPEGGHATFGGSFPGLDGQAYNDFLNWWNASQTTGVAEGVDPNPAHGFPPPGGAEYPGGGGGPVGGGGISGTGEGGGDQPFDPGSGMTSGGPGGSGYDQPGGGGYGGPEGTYNPRPPGSAGYPAPPRPPINPDPYGNYSKPGTGGGGFPTIYPGGGGGGLPGGVPGTPGLPSGAGGNEAVGSAVGAYQDALGSANQANEDRYDALLGLGGKLEGNADDMDSMLANVIKGLAGRENLGSELSGKLGDVNEGYAAREGYADLLNRNYGNVLNAAASRQEGIMGLLAGLGKEQKTDIDEQYERLDAEQQQGLLSRGLGNTTIQDSVSRGVASDRERAHGRLGEQLRREQADYGERLSGDTLGVMERAGTSVPQFGAQLSGDTLQARGGAARDVAQFQSGLTGDTLQAAERGATNVPQFRAMLQKQLMDVIEGRTDSGPDLGQLLNLILQFGRSGSTVFA
jgi:hypothetical protein